MPPSGSRSKPLTAKEARAHKRALADAAHDRYVCKTYGLQPGDYARMLADQDSRCAMCRRLTRRRRLAVDHDHNTGKVRGLLCYVCNKSLGQWEFDPISAYSAAQYIASVAEDYDAPLRDPLVEANRPVDWRLLPLRPLTVR